MGSRSAPRKGSLQIWPRKRAEKFLPRVNWNAIKPTSKNLRGFICYKVGMKSAIVKDNTANSMTQGKKIAVPITIISCPVMKIFSIRFYKNQKVMTEVLAEHFDKELKRKLKLPKNSKKPELDSVKDFDDISVICYSVAKTTGIKKTPDISEIGLVGNSDDKINWIKEKIGKEISVSDVFDAGNLVDLRGLTKAKGFQGPIKRFGAKLRSHKSEKGVRRIGSIGPWHPARTTFRVAMAGQMGFHTRVTNNKKILEMKKSGESAIKNIKNFGDVLTDYIIVNGSVQGPAKRQLILTSALRPTKKQSKKNYDVVEIV